jgi:predicted acetyltransferase
MKLELVRVKEPDKMLLNSLLELYENEPNDYEPEEKKSDEQEPYVYKHLDRYFTREHWLAYFIMADGKHAGFILISPDTTVEDKPHDYSLYEFFVMPEYRRGGIGRFAAKKIFDMYKGWWHLQRDPRDKNSVPFWNKVIDEYTKGEFEVEQSSPRSIPYSGGVLGDIFIFESK